MKLSLLTPAEPSGDRLEFEIVERKGRGHPDTICDSIAEEVSVALSRRYLEACGRVRHYNVDKALLWAGSSASRFGGGRLTASMELFVAGRATPRPAASAWISARSWRRPPRAGSLATSRC